MTLLDHAKAELRDGVIQADVAKVLTAEAGIDLEQLMLELIPIAQEYSMPELSGFSVGAIALGKSGKLYLGANVEFPNCPVDQTIHAEQAAVINAAGHNEVGLVSLAVSAPPCGYCRQFLFELVGASDLRILLYNTSPSLLTDYLPFAFGPGDLGVTAGLLSPQNHTVIPVADQTDGANQAFAAARRSYAPYTKAYGGAAIAARNGAIYAGMYLENAAFNPSISPMQVAIISATLSGCPPSEYAEIWVAQDEKSKIDHAAAANLVLRTLSPGSPLHRVDFRSS